MSHYTQIVAHTERPTQVLAALQHLDVYMFPHAPAGTVICERTSEAVDVRIIIQVSSGISWNLGRDLAVLAIAGGERGGFWCGLFVGGKALLEHNRLTGPSDFAKRPASSAEIDVLCDCFGTGVDREALNLALTSRQSLTAVGQHAAFAKSLGLPAWSPGVGYSRIGEGGVPPEAGVPQRPPRSLAEFRPVGEPCEDPAGLDSLAAFHNACQHAFGFLEANYGFTKELPTLALSGSHYPQIIDGVYIIGPSNLRPGYQNPYIVCYRSRDLVVVIEGLQSGGRTRLCLIDSRGRHLDLTRLVEHRAPELLDLCRLAAGQREQIPVFGEALRKCAADALAGDLKVISRIEASGPGFSFSTFFSPADGDYILSF